MENSKGLLITDGFDEVEMVKPRQALDEAGADTRIVSPKVTSMRSWNLTEWSAEYAVDVVL